MIVVLFLDGIMAGLAASAGVDALPKQSGRLLQRVLHIPLRVGVAARVCDHISPERAAGEGCLRLVSEQLAVRIAATEEQRRRPDGGAGLDERSARRKEPSEGRDARARSNH